MAKPKAVSLKRKISWRAGARLLMFGEWLASKIPKRAADRFGSAFGKLSFRLGRRRRLRTIANLKMCFPDWDSARINETAVAVYKHFGKTMLRFLRSHLDSDAEVIESIDATGLEHLDAALAQGKGVLIITAHFGNWERGGHLMRARGYQLSVIARNANDQRSTELINQKRTRLGVEVFPRGSAAKEVLTRLRKNEPVGILPDQNAKDIFVPFFGLPAGTVNGPAVFHLRTGAPLIRFYCYEIENGRYRFDMAPIEVGDLTGNRDLDVAQIMAAINSNLEEIVREHPSQWLWMHDRWKSARQAGLLDG